VPSVNIHVVAIVQVLVLIALANGTPVFAKKLLGPRWAWPLDGGLTLPDGQPLFGRSKTIRGIVLAIVITAAGAALMGIDPLTGALTGTAAMAGDLFSSFVKRRLRLTPSSQALGLDQVPESLLPFLVCRTALSLSASDVAIGVVVFFLAELVLSRLLFKMKLRDQPY
jgi:CDP-2,3-bis-(O-geranylgeranyl)-sn-glycerol synthase